MIDQPQEVCDVCSKSIEEGHFRVISKKTLNRLQKRVNVSLRCVCLPCVKAIRKTQKGETLDSVVWMRKVNKQIQSGIFPVGLHEMIADAENAKAQISSEISSLLNQLERKTCSLNFISSSLVDIKNAYGNFLWGTYHERRKRANYAISKADLRLMVFTRDQNKCCSCGSSKRLSIDHIKPVLEGGGDDPENLQTLCRSCNSRKGAKITQ